MPAPATTSPPNASGFVQEELLAVGGHGELYRGHDTTTGEQVVIKRLQAGQRAKGQEMVQRFIREGEMLRQLNHPNIVKMIAVEEQADEHLIVMEYVPGGSLRDLLEREGQLPISHVLSIGLELADALTRAHHLGIIHRDLKPSNVLLAADGTPRLTDFGIARTRDQQPRLTQEGSFMGSPAYMSPEAWQGQELDARSDIWSFGVLLYEMLAGRSPFIAEQMTAVLINILNTPPPDLAQLRADVPARLVTLIDQMLVKERDGRLDSMRLVGAELESILVKWTQQP